MIELKILKDCRSNNIEVKLLPIQVLEKIFHEHQSSDVNTILDTWRERGVIEVDKDGKFTRKRVVHKGATSQRVVVINVDKEYDQYKAKVE